MKEYLSGLPKNLKDSAKLDGISNRKYMLKILIPLSMPTIVTSIMMSFLSSWNGFLAPLIFLSDDQRYPISLKINSYVGSIGSGNPKWNLFAAVSVLNLLLIFSMFLYLKKPLKTTKIKDYE